MILFVKGGSGSGKSTAVKHLLDAYLNTPMMREDGRRAEAYMVPMKRCIVAILGRYETACGGVDLLPSKTSVGDILALIDKYTKFADHVLFERRLGSDYWGAFNIELAARDCVHAFMDTPLDVCVKRVRARRLERGNTTPLNPANTETHWRATRRMMDKIGTLVDSDHHHVIPYQDAPNAILRILGEIK